VTARLSILHLEDDPADAELIAETLTAEGLECDIRRAASRDQFAAGLEGPLDVILSDFALPGFDGASAQAMALARRPEVPFVFVSGTMGEELAIDRMKAGATDYVLKHRLTRLAPAVRRAVDEAARRRSERSLADANAFLDNLLAASPSMILRFEPDLRVTYVSPNVGWLLGYSPDEVVGVRGFWGSIVHPYDRGPVLNQLRDAIAGTVVQMEHEYRIRDKDGQYRWFFNLVRIEYGDDAQPTSMLGYALDISARKAAEEDVRQAHAFLDSIVENLPDMVFVKDARDLRFVRINRSGEELLGLRREDVLGKTDHDILPAMLADGFAATDREVLAGNTILDIPEEIVATRDRGPRVLHTKKIPINGVDGRPEYLLGISEDITDRRQAEEAARLARLEAERANRAKSEFLSRMSHDLRTPLNAILGFAQLIEMDARTPDDADSARQIVRGGRLLLDLINEVLDIASIEAGRLSLSPEPIRVADVVGEVVDLMRPLAASRRITVATDVAADSALAVRADRSRLRQVLVNFAGNAVKYNREAGEVRVFAEALAGGRVRIGVADNGPGIPADKVPLLFQPFERLGAEYGTVEGTGLGLALVKGVAEAMSGQVGVESEVGRGTTFWVDLPQAEAPASVHEHTATAAGPTTAASGTIVYVEDNASNVRLLQRLILRRPGVRLLNAGTGAAGIEMARSERPELVLLDLHLPDMPGEDVLHRLVSDPLTEAVPIAVLSADAMPGLSQRLLATGAVAFLTKPLDVTALLRIIDERLSPGGGVDP
jgi:PAS domain S-box-containing protein